MHNIFVKANGDLAVSLVFSTKSKKSNCYSLELLQSRIVTDCIDPGCVPQACRRRQPERRRR